MAADVPSAAQAADHQPLQPATSPPPTFESDERLAQWLNETSTRWDVDHIDNDADDWKPYIDGYEMAIAYDHPVSDQAHLIAYYMRGPMAMGSDGFDGDQPGVAMNPDPDGNSRLWYYRIDTTKSRRDDIGIAFEQFTDHMHDGSPVRRTDRSGPDTKGTRAVDGIGQRPTVAFR